MPTVAFITFGCKVNQYDAEALREAALALGYEEAPPAERADVYVVTTCTVTAEGFAKSRRAVLRAARRSPGSKILVVGCSTEEDRRSLGPLPQIALAGGNEAKALVPGFLSGEWAPGRPAPEARELWTRGIERFHGRTRACVKVQDGCDRFCSFCIVPLVRGRSRSRPPGDVVEEARRLAGNGYREIVVSGVRIQDYGKDLGMTSGLASLLLRIAEVPGILRIRLSSLGPTGFDERLLDAFENPVFCPHWHIPLQSGSDAVLARMRRDYRAADFLSLVEALRARFEDPSVSTDIVVGLPGETEADFEETLRVSRMAGFSKIHVFPYSRREGTLASRFGGEVPRSEIRRRARAARRLESELALAYKARFVGKEVRVLVEGRARSPGPDSPAHVARVLEGFTERYVRVAFEEPEPGALGRLRGTLQRVFVLGAEPSRAWGAPAGCAAALPAES